MTISVARYDNLSRNSAWLAPLAMTMSQTFSRKTKKIAQYGRDRAVGEDFRMILGGFAIFAVDIVRAISYNTICIVV